LPESIEDFEAEQYDEAHLVNDIEDANELDGAGEESRPTWEGHSRELLTSVLDYNLNTLSDLVTKEQIDLSPRYQRRDRWKADRQSKLIESFFMNVPIPPIFLNEDDFGKYSVIDGKQRLTAIYEFMRGRLRLKGLQIYKELNDKTIDDLSPTMQSIIGTRANLRATIILRQSDREVKFEVFRRLNTGGVSLNAQEIRNSTWPGPLNDLLLDLSENLTYRRMLGIDKVSTSTIYKEMRDVELVLRFFTFSKEWNTFSGGMARRLDKFMAENQRAPKAKLKTLEATFIRSLATVDEAFGDCAFRRYVPETSTWRSPILAALFDAQMFAALKWSPSEVANKRETFIEEYKALFSNSEFRQSIDAATNTPALFKRRIQLVENIFTKLVNNST
jgi:hypothetical protein